jgi:hypothetical protein
MSDSPRDSLENAVQGDFGEAWLDAVAAGCGLLHGRPATLDLDKADVQLTALGEHRGTWNPTVKVQVKTTTGCRTQPNGDIVYDLDVKTYTVLRRDNESVRRVLVVICLSEDGERVRIEDEGTVMVGRGAWVSLEGEAETQNAQSVAVHLPASNTLDCEGLQEMLRLYGVRSSTPVPTFDPWDES